LLGACNPYTRFVGEASAGAVDPATFPPAYLGISTATGAPNTGNMPGTAQMLATPAFVDGNEVDYYGFPYTGDPMLSLATGGALDVPIAYDFDDDTSATKCKAPANYVYDQQRDAVRFDQQGNIFIMLPDQGYVIDGDSADGTGQTIVAGNGYQPIVADVKVESSGPGGTLPCQGTKEEVNLVKRTDVTLSLLPAANPNIPNAHPSGKPTGTFYARAIIDPSIDVRAPAGYYSPTDPGGDTNPVTGLGPQKWGWYQRYLLAYIDGGAIPTNDQVVMDATGKSVDVTAITSQNLYFPSSHPGQDASGNIVVVQAQGPGEGFDVMTGARSPAVAGEVYSPLCEVFVYDPADPMNPDTSVKTIDMTTAQDTGEQIWCLQVLFTNVDTQ
jgi:hypothetical protein